LAASGYAQRVPETRTPALFGQVMALVAVTVGFATLGVYLFRHAGGAFWFIAWIIALGCLVGLLVDGYSATSILSSGQGGGKSVVFKLIVDARVLGGGLVFALLMGNIGGLLPALSAMRAMRTSRK